jgi:type II secretory pathway pseudopilin PulG
MRKTKKKCEKREGFTIIELLTVMSIIIILISILVPAMNKARQFAKEVQQKNQFKAINTGMEMYRNDFEGYPDSTYESAANTGLTYGYCGAMKLAEAMFGQDLLGFHPYSRFRSDYTDGINTNPGDELYQRLPTDPAPDAHNLSLRKGPYLELGNANAHRLWHIYNETTITTADFNREVFVLADVYSRVQNNSPTGKPWIGMPILYYRANISGNGHPHFLNNDPAQGPDPVPPISADNFYNYEDNDELVQMGMPWLSDLAIGHLMDSTGKNTRYTAPLNQSSAYFFYHNTYDGDIPIPVGRPHRPDSFILISAGFDGEYGTSDDITNFPQ